MPKASPKLSGLVRTRCTRRPLQGSFDTPLNNHAKPSHFQAPRLAAFFFFFYFFFDLSFRAAGRGKLWAVRVSFTSPSAGCSAPGCCGAGPLGSFQHGRGLARLWLRRPGGIRRARWLCKSR
ncbi:hypothetical protein Q9966_009076 [Columba livia]|nr:hypothetical protein Q9966_009076 [Columba livia]